MSNRFRTENPSWCFYPWWVHALRAGREETAGPVGVVRCSLERHIRVYRAIRDHEAQAAYDAMLAHILDVERLILQLLARNEAEAGRRDSGS
jgi:DNA-binding GntR family transcriptional regulator